MPVLLETPEPAEDGVRLEGDWLCLRGAVCGRGAGSLGVPYREALDHVELVAHEDGEELAEQVVKSVGSTSAVIAVGAQVELVGPVGALEPDGEGDRADAAAGVGGEGKELTGAVGAARGVLVALLLGGELVDAGRGEGGLLEVGGEEGDGEVVSTERACGGW